MYSVCLFSSPPDMTAWHHSQFKRPVIRRSFIASLVSAPTQPHQRLVPSTMASIALLVALAAIFAPALAHGNRKGGPMRCGLPPFANSDKMPADAKLALQNIWANYVEGDDCSTQRAETKALLNSLPESVRAAIRPPGGRNMCGLPPFLSKLSPENQEKVQAIWAGYVAGEDCQQQREDMRKLIDSLTPEERKTLRPPGGRGGNRGGVPRT